MTSFGQFFDIQLAIFRRVIFWVRGVKLLPKFIRLGTNGTNSRLLKIRFKYILVLRAKNVLNLIFKSPRFIIPFGAYLTYYSHKSDIPIQSFLNKKRKVFCSPEHLSPSIWVSSGSKVHKIKHTWQDNPSAHVSKESP